MRVMVLGATGFIGPAVLRRLAALGHEALAVSRHPIEGSGSLRGDRGDPGAIARLAGDQRIEAVIDLIAYTAAATEPLLQALAGNVGRYVLASSGDVYRQADGWRRKPGAGPPLARLTEDAPLRTNPHPYRGERPRAPDDPQAWMDDYDKIPIERAALAQPGLEAAVVRLPMVFGPGDRNRRFGWAIGPMLAGRPAIEVDAQWAAWRSTYGYVDDVAHAPALAAVHPAAAGRIFNAGPSDTPDHAAWAGRLARLIGWRGELRRVARQDVPQPLRGALDGLDLSYPLAMDTRRIRAELGYAEITAPDEALARTIADERSRAQFKS